ncbi:hypothetical protein [Reichenbachiella sp. MALMAid0571]|uniref:hypothetical protein n=1 Tax=Reichenbachiella sp. MALMAid0571 TaxID=3143939 RepID=UPI0032DE2F0C
MKQITQSALTAFIFSVLLSCSQGQKQSDLPIIKALEKIYPTPEQITFQNSLEIDNSGGHLQGIQYLNHNQNEYYVVSGSSSSYSYYSIVKIADQNTVISVNKLLDKPFKHAGGFQINDNLMAIGIEDNEAKDKSKVYVFRIDDPENPPTVPLSIIERSGNPKRTTAGSVGICETNNTILVVVGDWGSEHLDFYTIDKEKPNNTTLKYSLDSKDVDKSEWIDKNYLSYQNVNIVQDGTEALYLIGMTSNMLRENVLDLFELKTKDFSSFELKKIYSRIFPSNDQTTFRWGSGVYLDKNGAVTIMSCNENILDNSIIHIYQ